MTDVIDEIVQWGRGQFPGATLEGIIAKFEEEVEELRASGYRDIMEIADVGFMLAQMADVQGESLEDALADKLAENKARTWPERPDENGVYSHVRTT